MRRFGIFSRLETNSDGSCRQGLQHGQENHRPKGCGLMRAQSKPVKVVCATLRKLPAGRVLIVFTDIADAKRVFKQRHWRFDGSLTTLEWWPPRTNHS
ncbi:hypothetical protein AMTR_s00012p00139700 [Amborella trichopoda]|uniref:DUF4283 domain-containing protein n=1 Tax=Amborella trichopoda TaxID=13333 RepID=W1PCZ7_AMBTC|nr:hypothetical protein AMTR_s00012p00139700 [Amborella trichopoda]